MAKRLSKSTMMRFRPGKRSWLLTIYWPLAARLLRASN
ncbi:UNVERIFIED_CONTAM: hypothetical protein GTU68_060186 [Idotea baltica]|nr:hypothetical protein [Idotea baltica]